MPRDASFVVRPLGAHEWPQYRQVRLGALADSPDAFGATLAEEQARTDEVWAGRVAAATRSGRDCPLVAEVAGELVGLVWAKFDAGDASAVNLFQMWVAPAHRGSGIATALLREAIRWARSSGARVVQLDVTRADTSAYRLYLREGFQPAGTPAPLREGSPLLAQFMRLVLM